MRYPLLPTVAAGILALVAACSGEGNLPGPEGDDDVATDDDDVAADDDDAAVDCEGAAVVFDFDDGEQGFDHEGTDAGFDDPWEFGEPDHEDCRTGETCWATNLDGDYGDCEAGQLVSPTIDLAACAGSGHAVELMFWHLYRFENISSGTLWDGGFVQLSGDGGSSWEAVEPSPGYTGLIAGNYSACSGSPEVAGHRGWSDRIPGDDWRQVTVPVDEALRTDEFQVRLVFGSDRGVTEEGWYVDDVEIEIGQ